MAAFGGKQVSLGLIGSRDFEAKKREWWKWHEANPVVWEYFEKFSQAAVDRGRTKISHWLIVNRIRWEVSIMTTGKEFKISNEYIAFYARLWIVHHPEADQLFNIKRMAGEPSADPKEHTPPARLR